MISGLGTNANQSARMVAKSRYGVISTTAETISIVTFGALAAIGAD
jgi:hypothetical protein